ncbi:MAG TPA: glycosyltransferase [Burkholderiales bacterium]|jgi:hypothetical protein|nr:glycosyltransferase [Burkholderiales bacterium]
MRPLQIWRRKLRADRNFRRLHKELVHYRAAFESQDLAIPGDEEIRRRIASRFPSKRIRAKENLRLLAIYHSYNWEESSLAPSLGAFGTVRHLDWSDPMLADGLKPGHRLWRERMNEGLLRTAAEWNAKHPFDAVFTYLSGNHVAPETVAALRALGAPIINLSLNDKEAFVGKLCAGVATGMRDLCRHFDLCWTSTIDALEKYVVEGATPLYLPEGANPEVHRPYEEEKIFDVSFVGQCYGNRPEVISRLRDAGIRVEAFGPGWPQGPLTTEEMVRTWSRSKINLGFSGVLDHRETFCLKGRDFEVPMSGGLYLTEHHDELIRFYEIGREIVTYRNTNELLTNVQRLLAYPNEAEAIRHAGRMRALREHTWEMRFDRVFRLMGVLA